LVRLLLLLLLQGIKKTKLGLREFIRLGEFVQQIDTDNKLAVRQCTSSKHRASVVKGCS
jgi:hypothetical protein